MSELLLIALILNMLDRRRRNEKMVLETPRAVIAVPIILIIAIWIIDK